MSTFETAAEKTALDLASASGNREVTKCLAEYMGVMDPGDAMDVIHPDQDRQNMHLNAASSSLGKKEHSNPLGSDGKVSLHSSSALAEGNLDVLRSLLDHGADVNERDATHQTPLLVVSRAGKLEVAELLIKYGADVNCPDKYGQTPLLEAAGYGHHDIAKLLLDHGADVNAKQQDLRTPLHFAAWEATSRLQGYWSSEVQISIIETSMAALHLD
jgi:ankyrin repeat protein